MKIYIQDHGVYGCCFAIASSEEKARDFLESEYNYNPNYNPNKPLQEFEIKEGFTYCNLGDS